MELLIYSIFKNPFKVANGIIGIFFYFYEYRTTVQTLMGEDHEHDWIYQNFWVGVHGLRGSCVYIFIAIRLVSSTWDFVIG